MILRKDENILRGAVVLRGMLLDDLTLNLVQCNLNSEQETGTIIDDQSRGGGTDMSR